MAKHSRNHRRSLFSGIKKWMGFSHSTHKVRRTHFEKVEVPVNSGASVQAEDTFAGVLHAPERRHHRQAGGNKHYTRQKSKKGWIQQLRYKWTGLVSANKSTRSKSSFFRIWLRLKNMAGAGTNKREPELFYKLDKGGEYKLIQARPITATGINEGDNATEDTGSERIHPHRQKRPQGWTRHYRQLNHNFKKLFSGKRKHTHSHRSSFGAGVADAVPGTAQKDYTHGHSNGLKHTRFSFGELINSWLKLSFLIKLLSSAGLFMTAYVITWLTYSLAVMFTASFYDIYGVLYYFEVMWPESNFSPLWNANNAVAIALAGPFTSLAMSLIYFSILFKVKSLTTQFKTLFFWLFLLSMAHFTGAFVAGSITSQRFGYLFDGVNISFIFKLLIIIGSLVAMAFMGWKYARFILEIRPLKKHGNNIPLILINRMVLPCMLGILLLILIKIPNILPQHPGVFAYDVVILLSLFFAVFPPLFNLKLRPVTHQTKIQVAQDRTARAIFAIIFSVAVLILYRLGLSTGLYIYMKFAVHISSF